jgi:hypothetical protein
VARCGVTVTSEVAPAQAAFRFGLEIAALEAWAMSAASGLPGTVESVAGAVAVVVLLSASWGTFRVPGDASASGGAPVAVRGRTRLALELFLLLGAALAWIATGRPALGAVLGGLLVAHYAMTAARVRWLLEH